MNKIVFLTALLLTVSACGLLTRCSIAHAAGTSEIELFI